MRKLYKCSECGREVVILSKGMCPLCRSKSVPKKPRAAIKSKPKKKATNYSNFYRMCIEELFTLKMSEYSGKAIICPTTCNICHILPKRIYKSVAEDRGNIIFLTDEEHNKFDKFLDSMDLDGLKSEMPGLYSMMMTKVRALLADEKIKERGRLIYAIEKEIELNN